MTTPRSSRTNLSALLMVGLLIGVTISAIKPGVRALHRDASAELLATRHIAQTLVRAVRGLTGTAVHQASPRVASSLRPESADRRFVPDVESFPVAMLRESLLSMPPPIARSG